ncbi:hypothetical protein Lesp02_54580 [Lentzea sp. NBRC 105346]|uniref:hypothetical protein n=1 Tax=Lentzea sp. NBRC 105346 TaxID=3032205 RepID=UPI00249FA594|nr:hypothetical protein [Lentzea sp. NBRC 105346]GLZ33270.1 hypothetical protein Lesp02_54580 [Lentzea sp. NBRC 105346]
MNAPQYPQQYGWQQPYYPPPKPKKTGLIVLLVCTVLILVAGGITAAVLITKSKSEPGPAQIADAGPPDANVLKQRLADETVSYGATPVLDACTVMPADVLVAAGFGSTASDWITQTYLPASVARENATVKGDLDGISHCFYSDARDDHLDRISLSIDQTPFNRLLGDHPIGDEIEGTSAGLKTFSDSEKSGDYDTRILFPDGRTEADLRASNLGDIAGIDTKAAFTKLVDAVAGNLAKRPGGHTVYEFSGRYQGVPLACDLLSGDLFERLAGAPDSGVVEFESNVRELKWKAATNESMVYGVRQTCRRKSTELISSVGLKGNGLDVEFETFRDEDNATRAFSDCDPNSPQRKAVGTPMQVEKVGDGDACAVEIGSPNLIFRMNRTVVRLVGHGEWSPKDLTSYAKKFTPVAKTMADHLKQKIK